METVQIVLLFKQGTGGSSTRTVEAPDTIVDAFERVKATIKCLDAKYKNVLEKPPALSDGKIYLILGQYALEDAAAVLVLSAEVAVADVTPIF